MDPQQQQYTIFALVAVVVIGVVSFVFMNQKKHKPAKVEAKAAKKTASAPAAAPTQSSDTEGATSGTEAAKKKRKKRSKAKASTKGQVIAPVGQMDDAPESDDEDDSSPVPSAKPEPPVQKEAPKPKKTMEEKAFEEILKMDDKKNKDKKKDSKKGNGKKSPVVAKMEDNADESDEGEDAIFLTGKAAAAADGWAVVEKKGGKQAKKVEPTPAAPPAVEVPAPATTSTPSAAADELAPATTVDEAATPETDEAVEEEDTTPAAPPVPVIEKVTQELTVEAKRLGLLIGVKGATRIAIQSATDTNIQMPKTEKDSTGEVTISVTGEEAGVAKAITAMKELLAKNYCMLLADPDFRESDVTVHPRYLPDIIGKNGFVIKALMNHTGVKITPPVINKAPDGKITKAAGPDGKVSKVKIGLAGPKEKVALCRNLIKEITRYYHTEVTHPNVVHEEMVIDPKYYNFIIGAKGSEIKHIQNSYKVSVHIPDADSVNPNVLIVGEEANVGNAKRHVEKLIEKVNERNNPKPKEASEEDEDDVAVTSSSEAETPTVGAAVAAAQDGEESWMKELGPPAGDAFPATISAPIGLSKPENGKPAWNTLAAGKTW